MLGPDPTVGEPLASGQSPSSGGLFASPLWPTPRTFPAGFILPWYLSSALGSTHQGGTWFSHACHHLCPSPSSSLFLSESHPSFQDQIKHPMPDSPLGTHPSHACVLEASHVFLLWGSVGMKNGTSDLPHQISASLKSEAATSWVWCSQNTWWVLFGLGLLAFLPVNPKKYLVELKRKKKVYKEVKGTGMNNPGEGEVVG